MNSLKKTLADLVSFASITPTDAGCQPYMLNLLHEMGFQSQCFNVGPVSNFYAQRGTGSPLLVFAGHTDVVVEGDRSEWSSHPFILHERNGLYYGRGVADMKGSLAAMLTAAGQFVGTHPNFQGSLGFLITSAEEGDQYDLGTPYVMKQLHSQNIRPDFCIVGEPSSLTTVGDVIKIGRRGSLSGKVLLQGKQGHVAYPHLADNPIHRISAVLTELTNTCWDEGNAHFPPTSFQITHIQSGGLANNIIPGELTLQFNFRFSTEQTDTKLKQAVHDCFSNHGLQPTIHWQLSGQPFLTAKGKLLTSCIDAIHAVTQQKPELSTSGGTSDGRFIAPYGIEVIELGPSHATIHQVNECVGTHDLELLSDMYYGVCERVLL